MASKHDTCGGSYCAVVNCHNRGSGFHFFRFPKEPQRLSVKLAPKLTSEHIYLPLFSPTRVFSNTVYAGMNILASLGKLRCQAYMTADFVKKVNDAFDVLNVTHKRNRKAQAILHE
ncbi:hypothetical protein LSAT2_010758 [Lamellibrachia satsuma]|nr:hypothetical protein LSAT2_010758 [Lamellibrachia satsuma]